MDICFKCTGRHTIPLHRIRGVHGAPYYYWYSVSLESAFDNPEHAPFAPIFILVAGLFFFNTLISLKGLNLIKFEVPINAQKLGLYTSIGILAISVAGGVAFEVILAESGATDWWFNTGFYVGLIGGILMTVLYYLLKQSRILPSEHNPQ